MEKYKICPSCNTKNAPALFECINCETDLTGVKITDEETEKMIAQNGSPQSDASIKLVRLCECGAKNPPNARKCSCCREDISDVVPTADEEVQQADTVTFVLSSLDGQFAFEMTSEEVTIGREKTMSEYLSAKSYVSRSHARLTIVNNELFIENLSSTNYTYVNNQKISAKTKLNNCDEIGLGGTNLNGSCQEQAAYFLVRIV